MRVDVRLLVDLPEVYRDGDNTRLLPTGAINNAVLALAGRHTASEPETYALALARHFLGAVPAAHTVDLRITASEPAPLPAPGPGDEPMPGIRHFAAARPPHDHVQVVLARDGESAVRGGLLDVELFVTGGATFTGFARDAFTTTPSFTDRVFGARLDIGWLYAGTYDAGDAGYGDCRHRARRAVEEGFTAHTSRSSQHTFHQLGAAVLDACPEVGEVRVEGAHLTRALVDLGPFGVRNDGLVYTAADNQCSTVAVDVRRN
ncbi:hypothetical protein [Streptomyces sp. NPDC053048]|uniref:hypothetical protein n=1 Tax=Streptomyces sp. NPDC053048 TaxID=3365694 RepID=UPI0037CEE81F